MRRLLLFTSAVVLVDTMFYAAVTPLLPYYAAHLHLSKSAAGLITGSFPAGALAGSLPGGWIAARTGARPSVLIGLAIMVASNVVFGFAHHAATLDAARFAQGLGSAVTWSGSFSWLLAMTPVDRRGEVLGKAFSGAVGGALLGPLLGGLARGLGPGPVFSTVAGFGLALGLAALRVPAPDRAHSAHLAPIAPSRLISPRILAGIALIVLLGLFFGVLEVLVPLRLGHLGAGGATVAGTFLLAAALQALVGPLVGRAIDRSGPARVIEVALLCGVAIAALLPAADGVWPLAALAVLAGPMVGSIWVPGITILSGGFEQQRLDQAYAFAALNAAWAVAQLAGATGGAHIAAATSDAVPYALLGGLCLLGLLLTSGPLRAAAARAQQLALTRRAG